MSYEINNSNDNIPADCAAENSVNLNININNNEKLLFIDCMSAGKQKIGHVGVSGANCFRADSIKTAEEWLKKNLDYPYINITAHISVKTQGNGYKTFSFRYNTLYLKDE